MNERARTVLGHHEREGHVLEEVQRPAPVRIHLACELRFRSFRVWGCKEEKHRGSGSRAARPAERRQLRSRFEEGGIQLGLLDEVLGRCRANLAHIRPSGPNSGPGVLVQVLQTFEAIPSLLGRGWHNLSAVASSSGTNHERGAASVIINHRRLEARNRARGQAHLVEVQGFEL